MIPEILAPVGNGEMLVAAINSGADAVYVGYQNFNARRNAQNFTFAELKELVLFSHERDVKVYITLNTLISDCEIGDVLCVIEECCKLSVDAFIVSDIGLISIFHSVCPNAVIHLSTQNSIQTKSGLKLMKKLNIKRVILPREAKKEEISKLAEINIIETEIFVHGALCMCVSGQCYFSAIIGGRSGNRGLCAGICRLPFSARNNENDYCLSLKDLSLIEQLNEIKKLNISSVKIEGRMKRPEYVATTVNACRNSISDTLNKDIIENLGLVFSRCGFTSGYFDNEIDSSMFGIRNKQNVMESASVLPKLKKLYLNEFKRFPISFFLKAHIDKNISLTAKDDLHKVCLKSNFVCETAVKNSVYKENIKMHLSKLGKTPFFLKETEIEMDENIFFPMGEINALRQNAIESLLSKRAERKAIPFKKENLSSLNSSNNHKSAPSFLSFRTFNQIPKDLPLEYNISLPVSEDFKNISKLLKKGHRLYLELPRILFSEEENMERLLEFYSKTSVQGIFVTSLDAVAMARKFNFKIISAFTLNVFNSFSVKAIQELNVSAVTASVELNLNKIKNLISSIPVYVVIYGRIPIMLTRNCPIRSFLSCENCKNNKNIKDKEGYIFPVRCNGKKYCEIFNSNPIYLADKTDIDNLNKMFIFSIESDNEVKNILSDYENKRAAYANFTRGLYYRGVK